MKLEKKNGQKPLWSQVYEILGQRIHGGEYLPGTMLPTEAELMDEFGVSRVTIRQAMDALIQDELISRRRGSGTTVLPLQKSVYSHFRSAVIGEEHNERAERRVISLSYAAGPASASAFFGVAKNQPLLCLVRGEYIGRKPIFRSKIYISPVVPVDDTTDFSGSFYQVLRENGYPITNTQDRYTASICDAQMKRVFHLSKDQALINRERLGYSGKTPVEYALTCYLSDFYELTITQKA